CVQHCGRHHDLEHCCHTLPHREILQAGPCRGSAIGHDIFPKHPVLDLLHRVTLSALPHRHLQRSIGDSNVGSIEPERLATSSRYPSQRCLPRLSPACPGISSTAGCLSSA